MGNDHLIHVGLGIAVSFTAFVTAKFVATDPVLNSVLWAVVSLGILWALTIGHGVYYLMLPVGLCIYLLYPPIKLQNGNATEDSAIVRAYSLLPDRIVLIREFPSLNSLEGRSYFLRTRVRAVTEQILRQSSAIPIEIDASLAAAAYGATLPDLDKVDPETMDRKYIDAVHEAVSRVWREQRSAEGASGVFHLAGWYALLVDQYWRTADITWLEHAIL